MTHPVVPQVIELASPTAASLNLEVVGATFRTNETPPVLQINIRNPDQDTSLEDCERMSRALESSLDEATFIPEPYVLEISSPGISKILTTDRDFLAFKGFPITVTTTEAYQGLHEWSGNLISRNANSLSLNRKGRPMTIPCTIIHQVQLSEAPPM